MSERIGWIAGGLTFAIIWLASTLSGGIFGFVFGWIPGIILGVVSFLAFGRFWKWIFGCLAIVAALATLYALSETYIFGFIAAALAYTFIVSRLLLLLLMALDDAAPRLVGANVISATVCGAIACYLVADDLGSRYDLILIMYGGSQVLWLTFDLWRMRRRRAKKAKGRETKVTEKTSFDDRMAELDAIVAQCARHGAFETGVVRDASNRSNRDWPWWAVEIEQTQVDGSEKRRVTATITLRSTQSGEPGSFDASWRAQVWQGVGTDVFRRTGECPLDWCSPTPEMFQETMEALLEEAKSCVPGWTR